MPRTGSRPLISAFVTGDLASRSYGRHSMITRCGFPTRLPDARPRAQLAGAARLWGSISQPELVACGDQHPAAAGHDLARVATSPLSDLRSAPWLPHAARPRIIVQGHRAARPTPRGRRPPQNQPEAPPGLGRPRPARCADPTSPRATARSPPGHPGHGPAVAPPAGDQEVDLPAPRRSPTPRRHDHRTDHTDGQREPDLGLPAHPRRTTQARASRRRIHHPQDPQTAANTAGTIPSRPTHHGDGSCAHRPRPCWPWTSSTSTARSP